MHNLVYLLSRLALCAVLFGIVPRSAATTVIAPTFAEMVEEADLVFTGRALRQRSEWRRFDGQRSIVTLVTFEVLAIHKGRAGQTIELQFLGGKIGDAAMRVDAMPAFHDGERVVLFVERNGANASPLVGFYHGKFNVLTDGSMTQHDGTPLGDTAEIGQPRARRVPTRALTHDSFAAKVRSAAGKVK